MDKRIVIAAVSAVVLVALNVKLSMDYGKAKFQAGLTEGCNTGFAYVIKERYGVRILPGNIKEAIAKGCVDSNATVVQ